MFVKQKDRLTNNYYNNHLLNASRLRGKKNKEGQ